jgi:DNA invertase Pin-like site-specific DNA recombinase
MLGGSPRRSDVLLLDGYIRVSQVAGRTGPSFIAPVVQREGIERWAASQGVVIGQIFEELDESGARSDRPLLMEAIRRIESHESDARPLRPALWVSVKPA